jgi:hypothetical protein
MFRHRAWKFDPRISAIVGHLRAIEDELGGIGQSAGRRASAGAAAASNHIADAIGPILNDIVYRFRPNRRMTVDEAAGYASEAVGTGATFGNDALERITAQAKHRPLSTLAIAIGVGILIGVVSRGE